MSDSDSAQQGTSKAAGWYPGKLLAKAAAKDSKKLSSSSSSFSSVQPTPTPAAASSSSSSSSLSSAVSLLSSVISSGPTSGSTPPPSNNPPANTHHNDSFHHHSQFKPEWRGVIKKQGHRIKNWKSRYFIISNCMMVYYDSEADYLSPERHQKPLGYHIITSVTPTGGQQLGAVSSGVNPTASTMHTNDNTNANAKNNRISSSSASAMKLMNAEQEYVLETLEEKTYYLKFSQSSGFLIAAQRAIGVYLTDYQDLTEPQLKLAICLCHIGYIDISIQLLHTLAYDTSPGAEYLYHLGTAYLVNNNFDDAIIVLQECLDIQHDHILALINLATAFYCTNQMDLSKTLLESALSLEPSNIDAANNLTLLYAQSGSKDDFELAEFKIKYAITCRREEPRLYLTYAEILMSVNEIERAIDILFQGLKAVPSHESSELNMQIGALFFLKNDDKTEAIEYFQVAIGINPRNLQARELLQEALLIRENAVSTKEAIFLANERNREEKSLHTNIVSSILKHTGDSSSMSFDTSGKGDVDTCVLQGMLEKKSGSGSKGHGDGVWQELYFELNGHRLKWFLSGTEFTKHKNISEKGGSDHWDAHEEVTHILIKDILSISKVPGDLLQFDIEMTNGCTYELKSKSEHDTNTWLDALQSQRVLNSKKS